MGSHDASSWLYAVPVPGPSLELHAFVVERFIELGVSGGLAVWWRPIASPTLADPIYKALRTDELKRRDWRLARKYRQLCQEAGGESNYVRHQSYRQAIMYELEERRRPAVVLLPAPDCGERAILTLAPGAFETAERRRTLALFLYGELGGDRLLQFARDGVFGVDSIRSLQRHLDNMSSVVEKSIARDRGIPERQWRATLRQSALEERPNPKIHTKAYASLGKGGTITLRTETYGVVDGEATFACIDGATTLQWRLIYLLLSQWPRGLMFSELAHLLYHDEMTRATSKHDAVQLCRISKRLRTLIHDIRTLKFEAAGINPDVLPPFLKSTPERNPVKLRLAVLQRHGLSRHRPPDE